jgi:hypothetical protein
MPPVQGPVLELWKVAVCQNDVPPLQGGEHMALGQVGASATAGASHISSSQPSLTCRVEPLKQPGAKQLAAMPGSKARCEARQTASQDCQGP